MIARAKFSQRYVYCSNLTPSCSREFLISSALYFHTPLRRILNTFLNKAYGSSGPLNCAENQTSSVDPPTLHSLLLSYYRILQANRTLPKHFSWPISALEKIFTDPESDSGARLLATRCYFLQSGMGEAERIKLEQCYVGDVSTVDCPIFYSVNTDGSMCVLDGWVLPALEVTRTAKLWKSFVEDVPNYYYESEGMAQSFFEADLRWVTPCTSYTFLQLNT